MSHDHNGIGKRIKEFRLSCTTASTQLEFAEKLAIDQQRLSGYENGTRVPHHVIARLVELGANPYWLLTGQGSMRGGSGGDESIRSKELVALCPQALPGSQRILTDFVVLPLYADEVAAGTPREMRDTEIEGPAVLHRAWCPHPEQTDYVRVSTTGTSMEPTIPAGSIVTIDRAMNDPERLIGKVVAIGLREGGVTLKRLRKTARGTYIGMPDNPSAQNEPVAIGPDDRIIGLVQTVHARIG